VKNPLTGRVLPVVIGAAVVVGAANLTAYAANGHPFLLGGSNSESRTATLTNTGHGPAVAFKTSKSAPPFSVTSHKVVKNLNAAKVDGLDASVIGRAYKFVIPSDTAMPFFFQLKGVPKGQYAASLNVGSVAAVGPITPFCSLADSTSEFAVVSYGVSPGSSTDDIAINSASGLVKLARKGEVGIECEGADTTYDTGGSKNIVVLTPLAKVTAEQGTVLSPRNHTKSYAHR
jgi:hypothetical protein